MNIKESLGDLEAIILAFKIFVDTYRYIEILNVKEVNKIKEWVLTTIIEKITQFSQDFKQTFLLEIIKIHHLLKFCSGLWENNIFFKL